MVGGHECSSLRTSVIKKSEMTPFLFIEHEKGLGTWATTPGYANELSNYNGQVINALPISDLYLRI